MSYKKKKFPVDGSIGALKTLAIPVFIFLLYTAILAPVLYSILIAMGNQFNLDTLARDQFRNSLINSVKLALVVSVISVTLAMTAARHYRNVRWKKFYTFFMILPIFIPAGTHTLAIASVTNELGITLNFWTLTAAHIFWTFPFAFLIILSTMAGLPENITRAAMDLGANEWRSFYDIEFPLILDGIISAFLLSVLLSINESTRANTLGGSYEVISGVIYGYYTSTGLTDIIYTLSWFMVTIATVITVVIIVLIALRDSSRNVDTDDDT
jgi:ABC-type spermidine/putrescine transport system permease subunit II